MIGAYWNEYGRMLLIVCPLVFLASFVDAIAGGGGLIALPAYLFAGLPVHVAAGTNKLSSSCGTVLATWKFARAGEIVWKAALPAAVGALAGAQIGTRIALHVSDRILNLVLLIALPCVGGFLAIRRDLGSQPEPRGFSDRKTAAVAAAVGLAIGCYDGLIGPGTGTFLIIAFTSVMGFDLLTSSGCAKVANLASNVSALSLFLVSGNVLYPVGVPAIAFSLAGSQVGSRLAIRRGAKVVRILIFAVLGLLVIKTVSELW